jgi:hypothetical protein
MILLQAITVINKGMPGLLSKQCIPCDILGCALASWILVEDALNNHSLVTQQHGSTALLPQYLDPERYTPELQDRITEYSTLHQKLHIRSPRLTTGG